MSVSAHVRKKLVAGLLVVLPLVVTLWVLWVLIDLVDVSLELLPGVRALVSAEFAAEHPVLLRWLVTTLDLLILGGAVYLVGLLAAGMMGRRIVTALERWIRRVPVLGGVYGASRQLLDAVRGSGAFTRCVLIEYPRSGVRTLAFVTREQPHHLGPDGRTFLSLFIPTTPNPTSGFFLLVPREEVIALDLAVDEGIKLVMSGGMLGPDDLGTRAREPAPETRGPEETAWTRS